MGLRTYIITGLFLFISQASASLWRTDDQQAYRYFKNQEYEKAYHSFKNSTWKALAAYRAKKYQQAIQLYKNPVSGDDFYNLGNSYALLGDYQHAVHAYQKALSLDKNHQDAQYNLEIVKKLLNKQSQSKNNQEKKSNNTNQNQEKTNQTKENPAKSKKDNKQDKNDQNKSSSSPDMNQENNKTKKDEKKTNDSKKKMLKNNDLKKSHKKNDKKSDKELSQWLKLIENDPEGLLRQKFLRDYQRQLDGQKS